MATSEIIIDTIEETGSLLARLTETDGSQVAPNASGYVLTLNGANQYTIGVVEACVGIYRVGIENSDGLEFRFGYVWITADDVGPYYAVDTYVLATIHKYLEEQTGTNLTALPWNPAWDAEVQSEVADALAAYVVPTKTEFDAAISSITDKTDLIGTGTGIVNAPVTDDGGLEYIVLGDDYNAANDRAFEWTFPAIAGFTVAATGKFGGELPNATTAQVWLITNGIVTDEGSGMWKVAFDLDKAVTEDLAEGNYDWSVEIVEGGEEVTIAQNLQTHTRVKLIEKQTNA